MGNIGFSEILIIALVAVVLFGAGKIADVGKGLGQGIKNFKQGLREAEDIGSEKGESKVLPAAEVKELRSEREGTAPTDKKS
jgi:sec-independent protein translocase protein TatA